MTSIGNKEVFARNLHYYIERSGKTQKDLAEIVGVSTSAFSDWIKGKKYPRIDKIEMLANYFGILKSDLIEDKEKASAAHDKNDLTMGDVIKQLRIDRHLSLLEFSEEIGIPIEDIRKYEEGTKQLHASEINKISEYYNIEAVALIQMLLTSSGVGVTWEQHKLHIDHMIKWNEEFGYEVFTDEERNQLINYARFLLSQRKK